MIKESICRKNKRKGLTQKNSLLKKIYLAGSLVFLVPGIVFGISANDVNPEGNTQTTSVVEQNMATTVISGVSDLLDKIFTVEAPVQQETVAPQETLIETSPETSIETTPEASSEASTEPQTPDLTTPDPISSISTTTPSADFATTTDSSAPTSTTIPQSSSTTTSTSTPSSSSETPAPAPKTPNLILGNIFDNVVDSINKTVDNILDNVFAVSTSTESTIVPVLTEEDTDTGKLVTISAEDESLLFPLTNVLASTTIPRIYRVGEESKIQIKWKNENNQEMPFKASDTDGDGYLDLVEWIVPHLSTQTFEIIFISKAFRLDESKQISEDIYSTVSAQDGNYATIHNNEYLRFTFEAPVDSSKTIDIYAKPTNPLEPATIEVYRENSDELIATFNVDSKKFFHESMANLGDNPTDVFDFKIIGSVDIDYVQDAGTSITISTGADTCPACWDGASPTNTYTAVGVEVINTTTLAGKLAVGNVVLTGVAGDITVVNSVTKASGGDTTLTMYANGNIIVSAGVTSSSGKLNMLLNSDRDADSSGYINISGAITSNGGDITMGGGSGAISTTTGFAVGNAGQVTGILINNVAVSAGGGNIIANGQGFSTTTDLNNGVYVSGATGVITTTGFGTVSITGIGGGNTNSANNYGVRASSGGVISTVNGNLTVTGTGGGAGSGATNHGVYVASANSTIKTTGSGNVSVTGTGGNASGSGASNIGVYASTANGIQATGTGTILITGTGGNASGSGASNYGVYCYASTCIQPNATGSLTINGTGGGGESGNMGVYFYIGASVTGLGAPIIITGTGGNSSGASNHGVHVTGASTILSNIGTGTISVTGTGGGNTNSATNHGVRLVSGGVISTVNGNLTVVGQGGGAGSGANNYGVYVSTVNSTIKTTGSGNLLITGINGGGNTGSIQGLNIVIANGLQTTGTGSITINTDKIIFAEANDINSAANLTIKPYTATSTIGVGAGAGTLSLTDAYLSCLNWGTSNTLTIGATTTGDMAINTASAGLQNKNVTFITASSSAITLTSMLANTSAGTTTIQGGTTALNNANSFYNLTIDTTGNTATLGSALTVAGNLTLTNGTLDTKSGSNYAVTLAGNFNQATTAKFLARSSLITVNGNGNFTADGTMDSTQFNSASLTLNGANTLTYNNKISALSGFNNLTVGQNGNITTLESIMQVNSILTVGSGTLTTLTGRKLYLSGATPLSFDTASHLSVDLWFYRFGTQTIPTLINGYDCNIVLSGITGQLNTVTQTGNITLNSTYSLGLSYDTVRVVSWNTDGYNLTVGGNLQIGNNGNTGLTKLDATGAGGRTSTITVGGNWLNYGNGTVPSQFIADNSTVIFNSTSTGKTITSGATNSPFNNVHFSGTGGRWTLQDNLTASSTTLTQGTLVDNAKTVTVNGNISISNAAGSTLTSTGSWVQGASGNISNAAAGNAFRRLSIAGTGVTTTLNGTIFVGYGGTGSSLTIGPGTLYGANFLLYLYAYSNDSLTINNPIIGSSLSQLYLTTINSVTQKAFTLPNNFGSVLFRNNSSANLSATGNYNFGNSNVIIAGDTSGSSQPTGYTDMSTSSLITTGTLYVGSSAANKNGYIKLGSSAGNSVGSIAVSGVNTANILDLGSGATAVSGNINFTGINVTPGTATITLTGTSSANTLTSAGQSFYKLTQNGVGGTYTLQDPLVVNNNLTLTSGTMVAGNNKVTVGASLVGASNLSSTGNVEFTGSGTTDSALSAGSLTVDTSLVAGGNITVTDLTIAPGATLDMAGYTLTVTGSLANQGTIKSPKGDSIISAISAIGTFEYTSSSLNINPFVAAPFSTIRISGSGTYTLGGDVTGNVNILSTGVTIAGAGHTLTGSILGNNFGVVLSSINVTGSVSTTGVGAGVLTINNGANIAGAVDVTGIINKTEGSMGSLGNTTIQFGGSVSANSVSFAGDVVNFGTINEGNFATGKTINTGTINTGAGTFTFNATSTNTGTVNGNAAFSASSTNYVGGTQGTVTGNATFNSLTGVAGAVTFGSTTAFLGTGYVNTVNGQIFDSIGSPISSFIFNASSTNAGVLKGNAVFNNTSINNGTVSGNVSFNNSATNAGTITGGNVDVYSPVTRPIGGVVSSQVVYHGYSGLYFNDGAAGHGVVGKWDDLNNWWTDEASTIHSVVLPTSGDDVIILSGNILSTASTAFVRSATFEGASSNGIILIVSGTSSSAITFNASSTNTGTVIGNATFSGPGTDNTGSVNGFITRSYASNYSVEGALISVHNSYYLTVKALNNATVNLTNAVYTLWNGVTGVIFQAFDNASFIWGGSGSGTPNLVITSPATGVVIKWAPNISWGTNTLCQYKIDGGNYTSVNCANNGSDIPRPSATTHTIYFKSSDGYNNSTEKNVTFTYNNVSPVDTDCLSPLDEGTRQYYYLTSNVGSCIVATSTALVGNGFTAGSITGNNTDISFTNINATGTISAFNNITVASSTLSGTNVVNGSLTSDNLSTFGNTTVSSGATVYGGNFTGNLVNNGAVINSTTTPTTVAGSTTNNGTITGNFIFNATSSNTGTVSGNLILNASSSNAGTVGGNLTFNTLSSSYGAVTFSDGFVFLGTGIVSGNIKDASSNVITKWIFKDTSSNSGYTRGEAFFNDGSTNNGTIIGNVHFSDRSSGTLGTVTGNAYVYNSSVAPVSGVHGVVTGTTSYYSYSNGRSFNNAAGDNAWSNPSNWFTDTTFAIPLGRAPVSGESVVLFASTTLPSDITNDVFFAVSSSTLNGAGHKVTGSISGNGAYGGHNAYDFHLQNITVTGTTSAIGGDGIPGVSNGGRGGTINIDTSSTGGVTVNGGDPLQNGGDAGTSTISNSFAIVDGTRVLAVGGASNGCGFGGNGGNISLIDSSGYILVTATGEDATSTCVVIPPAPTDRSQGGSTIVGSYISPSARAAAAALAAQNSANNTNNRGNGAGSFVPAFLNINKNIGILNLSNLPKFGLDRIGQNLGVSSFVNPLVGVSNLKLDVKYPDLPKVSFGDKYSKFITATTPPKSIISVSVDGVERKTVLLMDKSGVVDKKKTTEKNKTADKDSKGKFYQVVTVEPNSHLYINSINSNKVVKAIFDNRSVNVVRVDKNTVKLNFIAPNEAGEYELMVGGARLVVVVSDKVSADKVISAPIVSEVLAPAQPVKRLSPLQRLCSWLFK